MGGPACPSNCPTRPDVTVVEPSFVPALPDEAGAVAAALAHPIAAAPLAGQVRAGMRVGIIFSDITRATPHHILLPEVLRVLHASGVRREDITLFEALGTHRRNTVEELTGMLGEQLVRDYRIVQNDCFDPSTQVCTGISSFGHEMWINRELLECDLKILTGFIEPHLFAGFSGGGKAIMPGMAGQRTVLGNHDAGMISHPNATWGVTVDNPILQEIREVAATAGGLFLLNVSLNRDQRITGVFAGDLAQAHGQGCAFVKRTAMVPVPRPFDIVITSNSGYPLDQSLYQSVKGMSAAALVVKQGGAIMQPPSARTGCRGTGCMASCCGAPSGPAELLATIRQPGFLKQDQWQAQIQAQIQLKADVYVRTGGLTQAEVEAALFHYSPSVEETVAMLLARYGPGATICVLPEGPQTIPYVDPGAAADGG